MIVERTQEGKAEARKKDGYREGRPRLSSVEKERMDHAMELLQTESYAQVTKMTGIRSMTAFLINSETLMPCSSAMSRISLLS